MRKLQQKKILGMLNELEENHDQLRKNPKPESVADLLANCQNFAIQIGEYIEEIEGEGTQTVSLLEDYCELAYQAYTGVSDANYAKKLQSQAIKIENSVRSELKPNKIEAVFFPYQLSMFDSFHSVYLAAKADPCCDVYVIPIPWYEKNSNGTLGEMHYDGDQYPEGIPVTDWQEYDVETRHPDVIFTHAPFDLGGAVTSLHPDFYSKRLRELTDFLCYIPYFVCTDDVSDYHVKTEGCAYAHKVIVQSEKVRDTYVRIFREAFGDQYGKPKDKFVALGSPKFDAVINAKREDYKLPEEWSKLINGKKVILYNTTIAAALENNEQYLKKIRSVFDIFRERGDVMLWWRPHPLMEANYRSMRPHLLVVYQQIVKDYKQEGWGIYDDTPDLHRAIAWTDAYYVDMSSLVAMYGVTGKPVMISSIITYGTEYQPLSIHVANKDVWFSIRDNIDALVKVNKTDNSLEIVRVLNNGNNYSWRYGMQNYASANTNGVICFPPFSIEEVVSNNWCSNAFGNDIHDYKINMKSFIGVVTFGKYIFYTPYLYPAIIRLSTETNEISRYSDWVQSLEKHSSNIHDAFFLVPLIVDDILWLASSRANAVVAFDMNSCSSQVYEVGVKGYRYGEICFDGESFWLTPRHNTNTPIIKWNPKTGIIKEFCEIYSKNVEFANIVYCEGYVWLLPYSANHAYKINTRTDEVSIAEEFEHDTDTNEDDKLKKKYSYAAVYENSIFTYREFDHRFIQYAPATKQRKEIDISIQVNDLINFVAKDKSVSVIMAENAHHKTIEASGQRIYNYVRSMVI